MVQTPQTIAVAHLLAVTTAAFHCSVQIIESKDDLDKYKSFDSFQKAASGRSTYKKSLIQLADFLWNERTPLLELESEGSRRALRDLPPTPDARRTRNNDAIPTQNWNSKWHGGFTPTRIRGRPGHEKKRQEEEHRQRREGCLGIVPCVRHGGQRFRCELCGKLTAFYCSGCRSSLCFQTGNNEMKPERIKAVKTKLGLSDDHEIKPVNRLSHYNQVTGARSEIKVLNSCYHIAHGRQFTSFFSGIQNTNRSSPHNLEN